MTAKLDFHVVDMEQAMQESAKTVGFPTNCTLTKFLLDYSRSLRQP